MCDAKNVHGFTFTWCLVLSGTFISGNKHMNLLIVSSV